MNKTEITLFKYRAINEWSLDTLRTGKMWFSLPAMLNDTFEFNVPVFIPMSSEKIVVHYLRRFSVENLSVILLDAMMKHGGGREIPVTESFINGFLQASGEHRSLYSIGMAHFLKDKGLSIPEIVRWLGLNGNEPLRARLEEELREAYLKNLEAGMLCGVLSLSADNASPLMWAHYADSCRGMCIGVTFDIDTLVESDLIPMWVEYASELPELDAFNFYDRGPQNALEMMRVFYGTKHTAWSHEKEFRLMSMRGDSAIEPPGKLTEVILGEKADAESSQKVLEALSGKKGVKLLRMMREPGTWNYSAYGDVV